MDRGRPARERNGGRHAKQRREFALEGVYVWPERRNPAGIESVEQQFTFCGSNVWWRKVDAAHRGKCKAQVTVVRRSTGDFGVRGP